MAIAELAASAGVAFLVAAGVVFEIIAAMCSSPQTAQINAAKRSATLMKWVYIGLVTSALFVAVAAFIDAGNRHAIVGGGVLAAGLMWVMYAHANRAGLRDGGPSTEQY